MNIFCNLKTGESYQENRPVNAGFRLAGSQCHTWLQEALYVTSILTLPSLGLLIFKMGRRRIPLQRGHCEMECMVLKCWVRTWAQKQTLSQPYVKCTCYDLEKKVYWREIFTNISYWLHHCFLERGVEFSQLSDGSGTGCWLKSLFRTNKSDKKKYEMSMPVCTVHTSLRVRDYAAKTWMLQGFLPLVHLH